MERSFATLGVTFCRADLNRAAGLVIAGRGDRPLQVCLANVHSVVQSRGDEEFRAILNDSLTLADGMPIVWTSRLRGEPLPCRVSGPDLFAEVMRRTIDGRTGHLLFGGDEGVAQEMAARVARGFPGVRICGAITPPFGAEFDAREGELVARINDAGADILWLGVSSPRQDKFIRRNLPRLRVRSAVGIGAAFNFFAGRVKRAPGVLQRSGLEWAWRLTQEPGRLWRRYLLEDARFPLLVAIEAVKGPRKR